MKDFIDWPVEPKIMHSLDSAFCYANQSTLYAPTGQATFDLSAPQYFSNSAFYGLKYLGDTVTSDWRYLPAFCVIVIKVIPSIRNKFNELREKWSAKQDLAHVEKRDEEPKLVISYFELSGAKLATGDVNSTTQTNNEKKVTFSMDMPS